MIKDSRGRSAWVGRAETFSEYQRLPKVFWSDPYVEKPTDHLLRPGFCAVCKGPTEFRLGLELWLPPYGFLLREALSCQRCTMNARMRAALQYIDEFMALNEKSDIYITERVTALFSLISSNFPNTIGTEYLPGVPLGEVLDGVRCEDLSKLTFPSNSFDALLTFDVLEHVPDYRAAVREIARVLKPGGKLLLSVPFHLDLPESLVRARIAKDGTIEHLMPEVYHGNPLGPPSLAFMEFGWDLLTTFRACGLTDCAVITYQNDELGYLGQPQPLLVAVKPGHVG